MLTWLPLDQLLGAVSADFLRERPIVTLSYPCPDEAHLVLNGASQPVW
jgi:hypothetical protein